jgi:uncharacterized delta-60 repeat protein
LTAQSGSLDPSFGTAGLVLTTASVFDVAAQGDGKIVAVGREGDSSAGTRVWAIYRYLADGSADAAFGTGGKVTIFFSSSSNDTPNDVELDATGRILVTGWAVVNGRVDFTVARLNTDGSLDTSFGGTGIVRPAIGNPNSAEYSHGLGIDPATGRIVIAGWTGGKKSWQLAIVRLLGNGALDSNFDGDGIRLDDVSSIDEYMPRGGVVVQPDGRVLVAFWKGFTHTQAGANQWVVARYGSNGGNDTSFGAGGKVFGSFAGLQHQRVWGLALQTDGKIVASGRARPIAGGQYHTLVARYLANGALDTTFDGDGWTVTTDLVDNQSFRCALQGDGKIVVAGGFAGSIIVDRFLANGTLDASFDGDGYGQTPGLVTSFADGVGIDPMGGIVVGGPGVVARYLQ